MLAALAASGFATVEEPGRRIVREELAAQGSALPWVDPSAFARRALSLALADYQAAPAGPGWTFFDRSWIDAASALDELTGETHASSLRDSHRYHGMVFLTPPWPEIFVSDDERQHGLGAAVDEYERLLKTYSALGYRMFILPKLAVEARLGLLLEQLPP